MTWPSVRTWTVPQLQHESGNIVSVRTGRFIAKGSRLVSVRVSGAGLCGVFSSLCFSSLKVRKSHPRTLTFSTVPLRGLDIVVRTETLNLSSKAAVALGKESP